jgi:hypothetical protein
VTSADGAVPPVGNPVRRPMLGKSGSLGPRLGASCNREPGGEVPYRRMGITRATGNGRCQWFNCRRRQARLAGLPSFADVSANGEVAPSAVIRMIAGGPPGIGDDFHPDRGANARLVVESAVGPFLRVSGFAGPLRAI